MILYLHLLAAVTWIGGIIFHTMMGDILRVGSIGRMSIPGEAGHSRDPVNWKIARRFRNVSWIAVLVLVLSGLIQLAYRGWEMNALLHAKLTLVTLMILIKILHDFILGPKVGAYSNTPQRSSLYWKTAFLLGRSNLILGLIVLFLAILL